MSKRNFFKLIFLMGLMLVLQHVGHAQTCEGPLSVQMIGSASTDSIEVEVDAIDITCASDANGSLILSVDGGNPDYSFSWGDDVTIVDSVRYDLAQGSYNVTITDSEGCTEVLSWTVEELDASNSELIGDHGCGVCWIDNGESTYFFDSNTKYIAAVSDQAGDMIDLESTEVCVYVDDVVNTCNDHPYLQRHWSVNPNNEEDACIKLFFTQEELNNLAANVPGESVDYQNLIDNHRLCLTALSGGNESCDDFTSQIIYSTAASPPLLVKNEDLVKGIWSVEVCTDKFATFYLNVCDYLLPVDLVYFDGEKTGTTNTLTWKTASEFNTSHFELERSANGYDFDFLTKLNANGNSNQILTYKYLDETPSPQLDYYRLKIVDLDGTFAYSNIIIIERRQINSSKLYPTLFDQYVYFETELRIADELEVVIFDALGRVAHYQQLKLNSGKHKIEFKLDRLPVGTYFFEIYSKTQNVSEGHKLVKRR